MVVVYGRPACYTHDGYWDNDHSTDPLCDMGAMAVEYRTIEDHRAAMALFAAVDQEAQGLYSTTQVSLDNELVVKVQVLSGGYAVENLHGYCDRILAGTATPVDREAAAELVAKSTWDEECTALRQAGPTLSCEVVDRYKVHIKGEPLFELGVLYMRWVDGNLSEFMCGPEVILTTRADAFIRACMQLGLKGLIQYVAAYPPLIVPGVNTPAAPILTQVTSITPTRPLCSWT